LLFWRVGRIQTEPPRRLGREPKTDRVQHNVRKADWRNAAVVAMTVGGGISATWPSFPRRREVCKTVGHFELDLAAAEQEIAGPSQIMTTACAMT
jgi:hypothetical protein